MAENNPIEAFPLEWPEHYKRTPSHERKYSNFVCTVAQARDGVLAEIARLKGVNPIISSNVPTKRDGQMYGNAKPVDGDPGVAVYFTWDSDQYVLACDQYVMLHENLRAIEKSIEALRGLKRWGASDILKRAFTGFKAIPASFDNWWDVLDVREDAHANEVKDAYRILAKQYHPDNEETGNEDMFIKVNRAWTAYNNR